MKNVFEGFLTQFQGVLLPLRVEMDFYGGEAVTLYLLKLGSHENFYRDLKKPGV